MPFSGGPSRYQIFHGWVIQRLLTIGLERSISAFSRFFPFSIPNGKKIHFQPAFALFLKTL